MATVRSCISPIDSKAVYVPTTEGYGILLSPSEPEKFLSVLNALGR